jgi:hypothetical protein
MDLEFSAISVLRVPNCQDENTRIQVAAVNRVGCMGINSYEVQPSLLDDIPTTTAGNVSTPIATTFSKYFNIFMREFCFCEVCRFSMA